MTLASDDPDNTDAHPYWYARVLGVYHVHAHDVMQPTPGMQCMEVLFVRWFGEDTEWHSGWKMHRMDRVGFIPESDNGVFGFLDPISILRGCHLIPVFKLGRTNTLLHTSHVARREKELDDWDRFYINR